MSKPKHTPGPWEYYGQDGVFYIEENGIPENTLTIATVEYGNEANARLIAAAPELLEMLRLIKLDGYESKALDALILKATGGAE